MKCALIVCDSLKHHPALELIERYTKRLSHYTSFEIVQTNRASLADILERYDRRFLFDEHGHAYTSPAFASFIEKEHTRGARSLAFVIGDAYGFDEKIHKLAHGALRLSDMTLAHDIAELVALEQLYRAWTIIKNEPYHHS
jgi:23S rRNA (pseudouridine1915-N3)-methyltransferase